jgi:hypothetical protein
MIWDWAPEEPFRKANAAVEERRPFVPGNEVVSMTSERKRERG